MRKNKETGMSPKASKGPIVRAGVSDPFGWFTEMDRWFDDLRHEFGRTWIVPAGFSSALGELGALREPAVDVKDNGTEFVVAADVPGVSKDDLDIEVTPEGVEIRAEAKAEREEKDENYFFRERNYTAFVRALPLPAQVDPEKVVAELKDGVLQIRLPKREPTPAPKTVKVKVQ